MVGIDDSVTSMRAGAYASGLARRHGARLICVYVERLSAMPGAIAGQDQALQETAASLWRRAEEEAGALGVSPSSSRTAIRIPSCDGWPTRSAPTPS